MNLKNKKILITGATGGIGHSLVEKFYNFGAKVVAYDVVFPEPVSPTTATFVPAGI